MNGTAARRSVVQGTVNGKVPPDFVSQNLPLAVAEGKKPTRGRTLVHGFTVQLAYASIDVLLVCAVGAALVWMRFHVLLPTAGAQLFDHATQHAYRGFFLLYAILVVLTCASQDLYRTPRDRDVLAETLMVTKAVITATLILVLFIFISGYNDVSRPVILLSGVMNTIILSSWRYFKRRLILRRTAAGIGVSRVLIVGSGPMAITIRDLLNSHPQLGYQFCGFLGEKRSSDPRVIGTLEQLRSVAISQFADEVFITLPTERQSVKCVTLEAYKLRLGVKIFADLYDGLGWSAPIATIAGFPVMDLHWQPISRVGLSVKRFVDIVTSAIGLVFAAPLLALLALCIRLDSPGPAIYAAERAGIKGRKFRCFKLRTMQVDADAKKENLRAANERCGPFFKMENDPRVTRVGRWLRKTSLDELPQLWNILRGEMSLVGPRPHPLDDFEQYSIEHLRRLDVSPGLTGLWQVTARRDPSFETNMALDLEYIENWSLGLDLKILLKTFPALMRADGR
jgi:exopolysaccharide biosynthesis polyprenyl glycosylphosphotransferase